MTNNQTTEYIHCAIHDRNEPVTPESIVCTECRHVFESELDLVILFNAEFNTNHGHAFEIPHCPLCLHDF